MMAMLAGPRQKQKVINLRAKNNAWSNDVNKFGQKMLEKMGWQSGKGLGAKENGIVEHVIARYKNDDKGLGFEDKNDQWTKHEDDFNALLSNLSNDNSKEAKLHSGVSLEVKSKKSKSRVHYHKFTRGKDLSRYSEKDLANIFGKKTLKEKKELTIEELPKDEIKTTVFKESGSMDDYFKTKMNLLKSSNKSQTFPNFTKPLESEEVSECAFKGFSGSQDDKVNSEDDSQSRALSFQPFSFYSNCDSKNKHGNEDLPGDCPSHAGNDAINTVKDKIKKKKRQMIDEEDVNDNKANDLDSASIYETDSKSNKKRKKKSRKNKTEEQLTENLVCDVGIAMDDELESNKRKRKNKGHGKKAELQKEYNEITPMLEEKTAGDEEKNSKKKKRKHSKLSFAEESTIIETTVSEDVLPLKKKKRKKDKIVG